MKKILLCAMLLVGMLGVSCSDSDDGGGVAHEQLIGTWDCYLETYTDADGYVEEYSYEPGESYVVFTRDEVTMYDDQDVMNGNAAEYKIKGNKLYIGGFEWCDLEMRSAQEMVWRFEWIDDEVQHSYFRKRR